MTIDGPTDEQLAFIAAAPQAASIMGRAYAGTGKTSTLKLMSREIRGPALALAFNRKITAELSQALPPNFLVKSLNGLGHAALQRTIQTRLQVDDRKLGKLLTQINRDRNLELTNEEWDSIRQVTAKAMQAGITPNDRGNPILPDEPDNWRSLWDALDLPGNGVFDNSLDIARNLLEVSIEQALAGQISYDDQIYIPVCIQGAFPRFPIIFADEFQDFSPLNHQLMLKCANDDTKLVVAGDPLQSIYAFRGADALSMDTIRPQRTDWLDLSLTLTFRCPKVIVSRQQHHAPGYRAHSANPEGAFHAPQAPQGWNISSVGGWNMSSVDGKSIAILCRNNAPLLSLAFKLLRRGIGVQYLGRDIGRGLIALSRRIIPDDTDNASECAAKITAWAERECSLARAAGKPDCIDSINDRAESLQAVLSSAGVRDAGELRSVLQTLFARDDGLIVLSTIHRAKGLEWDVVIHLDPWRLPSRFAIAAGGLALQQEHNLQYVCETRTRHTLIEANLKDFR